MLGVGGGVGGGGGGGGGAEIVSILKCILHLDHTYHYARSILMVSAL